jgi:hypothetical protein
MIGAWSCVANAGFLAVVAGNGKALGKVETAQRWITKFEAPSKPLVELAKFSTGDVVDPNGSFTPVISSDGRTGTWKFKGATATTFYAVVKFATLEAIYKFDTPSGSFDLNRDVYDPTTKRINGKKVTVGWKVNPWFEYNKEASKRTRNQLNVWVRPGTADTGTSWIGTTNKKFFKDGKDGYNVNGKGGFSGITIFGQPSDLGQLRTTE